MRREQLQPTDFAADLAGRARGGLSCKRKFPFACSALAGGVACLALAGLAPTAGWCQSAGTQSAGQGANTEKPIPHHKHRPSAAHKLIAPAETVTPPAPPVPEPPKWPVNDKPAEANVVWDSHGLSIDAANSSLDQILKDVSMATGAQVEGLSADQRVFGDFGPGLPRDVLSQLLSGSGYNVVMIGDQGQGVPRQILLSMRQAPGAQPPAAHNNPNGDEDDVDEQPAPGEPPPNHPGFGPPGVPPRSPQQIMQEMQQRQLQLQQQQQQANPNSAPN